MKWRSYTLSRLIWAFVCLLLCIGLVLIPTGRNLTVVDVSGLLLFGSAALLFVWEAVSDGYWRKLYPEAQVIVESDGVGISVTFPKTLKTVIRWDALQAVEIITSDLGPFVCDFHLRLIHTQGHTDIPLGAQGYEQVFRALTDLPGFDQEQAGLANRSTGVAVFKCWRRTKDESVE